MLSSEASDYLDGEEWTAIVTLNRTEFLGVGSAAPALILNRRVKPMVLVPVNGNQFKNGGTQTCVERAFDGIVHGEDVLDALIADEHQRTRPA